jgi:hypothetical protein
MRPQVTVKSFLSVDSDDLETKVRRVIQEYFRGYPEALAIHVAMYTQGRGGKPQHPIYITTVKAAFGPSPVGVPAIIHLNGTHGVTCLLRIDDHDDEATQSLIMGGPYAHPVKVPNTEDNAMAGEVSEESSKGVTADQDAKTLARAIAMRQELPEAEHAVRTLNRRGIELRAERDRIEAAIRQNDAEMGAAQARIDALRFTPEFQEALKAARDRTLANLNALKELGLE